MIWFVIVFVILSFSFLVYILARLFAYIKRLEDIVQEQVDKNENMFQSLKEIVQDDFLLNDGRLKKMIYQNERNLIYNGIKVNDSEVEI